MFEKKAVARQMWKKGKSVTDIALFLGVSPIYVLAWLERGPGAALKAEAQRLYLEGEGPREIARHLGAPYAEVKQWVVGLRRGAAVAPVRPTVWPRKVGPASTGPKEAL